ncbi:MlaD family protein [Hippea sp. KM1]|uniref:MlaD family protein n=1 Tax=Hippea sp. KM1 TaxID=944481 RepID=UPI00046CD6A7|nr:MlaD family protein [Hippea sp. KM1]
MEPKVNYALVGIFVVVFGVVGVGIVLWLLGGSGYSNYKRCVVYTNSNISGLHTDSDVRYKGFSVGKVESIEIEKKHPDFFRINILVDKNLPVDGNTVAQISSNGLTGISYINLFFEKNPPRLPFKPDTPYPTIPSIPSKIEQLTDVVMDALDSINRVAESIDRLMDNSTISNFQSLIKNSNNAAHNIAEAAKHTNRLMSGLEEDVRLFRGVIVKLDNLTVSAGRLIDTSNRTIDEFRGGTLVEGYYAIKKLKRLIDDTRQLIDELRYNPSLLINGRREGNR